METQIKDLGGIVYSEYRSISKQGEQFIAEHYAALLISGNLGIIDGEKTTVFKEGDIVFFRKNSLSKYSKQPTEQGIFRAITVILDKPTLLAFTKAQHPDKNFIAPAAAILSVGGDNLLKAYFDSLASYFNEPVPKELIDNKKQELIHLLIRKDALFKNLLFDFEQPGKIDLESFMNRNFRFNVGLDKFALLTGRSLATFKRDFEKIFHAPPNRWLQQQRLKQAHYLIGEKRLKPSDVYLEVGFESFPHFSFAFKQFFGKTPSSMLQ
jgi:AraC-like DNA-binding protein